MVISILKYVINTLKDIDPSDMANSDKCCAPKVTPAKKRAIQNEKDDTLSDAPSKAKNTTAHKLPMTLNARASLLFLRDVLAN